MSAPDDPTAAAIPPPGAGGARWLPQAAWAVVLIALAFGAGSGIYRGLRDRPDWGDFRYESKYVWTHHQSRPGTAMFGYLPTATFLLCPFSTWLPQPAGTIAWVALNTAAVGLSLWIVRRCWLAGAISWRELGVPAFIAAANLAHGIQSNQMTLVTLVLCVAGLAFVHRARGGTKWPELSGGLLLGLAALVKTLPALFVVYLLLLRRWRALAGMLAAVVLFDVLPSVAWFGVQGAIDEHRAWLVRAGWHSNRHLIEQPFLRVDRHTSNAAYAAVLTRWLREPPSAASQVILCGDPPAEEVARRQAELGPSEMLVLDPMPTEGQTWAVRRIADISWVPRFHVAALSADAVYALWRGTMVAGLVALAGLTWYCGRAGGRVNTSVAARAPSVSVPAWAPLAALWLLAVLWPSPMMRHYYLAWAWPAIAVVWCAARSAGPGGRRLVAAALGMWLIGAACLGAFVLRWYGIHLAALALLMAATSWAAWLKRASCGRQTERATADTAVARRI